MAASGNPWTLAALAAKLGLTLDGDGDIAIDGVCSLQPGRSGAVAFFADPRYRAQLAACQASALILRQRDRAAFPGAALIAPDPALAFAQLAALFDDALAFEPGVHASASIADDVRLGAGVGIGAQVVIERGVSIGDGCWIGPGCVIQAGAVIGPDSRLESRVHVGRRVRIGARAHIQPGAVIGGRGFGLVPTAKGWVEAPQVGSVVIGDDVEIGSNTCIDRGAIDDTVIEDGVKLDNLIQIAHNCRIGAGTAIASCAGIAGSTTIGKRCLIGGAAGIGGHLKIADGVVILGRTMVTKSLPQAGVYGSGIPVMPAREWRRTVGRVRRLGSVDERIAHIEQLLNIETRREEASEPDDT